MSERDDRVRDQMATEISTLRQRAEAAGVRHKDACAAYLKAESDLSAERDLKRIAYKRLDEVRTVVEETIIPALEACLYTRTGSVRDDVCDALAAARKTLEDEQREGVTT